MRWQRLDVWDGTRTDRDGKALEDSIRQKTGAALAELEGVAELLDHAHRAGRFDAVEAARGAALVRQMNYLRWLLTSVLLQPNQPIDDDEE